MGDYIALGFLLLVVVIGPAIHFISQYQLHKKEQKDAKGNNNSEG